MFDVGFTEIVLTSAVALIVLGPEKLPKVARQVGNWMGRARVMARQLTEQLEREVTAEELLRATEAKTRRTTTGDTPGRSDEPVIAPPTAPTPPAQDFSTHSQPSADAPGAEPVYGLPASATTPAAMHAADPEPDTHSKETPTP